MINLTHKNRYENIKKYNKKIKVKENNLIINDDTHNYGVVIETTYNNAYVLYNDEVIESSLEKTFNMPVNKTLYVGDKVILDDNLKIKNVLARKNILSRDKIDSTKINGMGITKVVATNIDLAVIVVSFSTPPLHPKFIDRYIILLRSNNIPFIVVINKKDLKTSKEDEILEIYKNLGITIIETSTNLGVGIENLKNALKNKQTIFVGHSGVGKSSLVNALMECDSSVTGSVGEKTKKGRHTTTNSKYYKWDEFSSIIDTPGIRSLDISDFKTLEIQDYFEEIKKLKHKCKYVDCLHNEEDISDCYIKQAVLENKINLGRYESYKKIIDDILKK